MTDETREKLREIEEVLRSTATLHLPESFRRGQWVERADVIRALLEAEEESGAGHVWGRVPWFREAAECERCGVPSTAVEAVLPCDAPEPEPEEGEPDECPPHGPWLYSVECNAYECQSCGDLFDKKEPYSVPSKPSGVQVAEMLTEYAEDHEERIKALEERVDRIYEYMRGTSLTEPDSEPDLGHTWTNDKCACGAQRGTRYPCPDSEREPEEQS